MKNKIDWRALIAIVLFALIALTSCECKSGRHVGELTEAEKWELFKECSKDEGDLGCEICYQKVFGHPSEGYYFSGWDGQ